MADVKHSVTIDLRLDTSGGDASLKAFQDALAKAARTAHDMRVGGGATAGGGSPSPGGATTVTPPAPAGTGGVMVPGAAPTPGGGVPAAPSTAMVPGSSGGTPTPGGGHTVPVPAPAIAPSGGGAAAPPMPGSPGGATTAGVPLPAPTAGTPQPQATVFGGVGKVFTGAAIAGYIGTAIGGQQNAAMALAQSQVQFAPGSTAHAQFLQSNQEHWAARFVRDVVPGARALWNWAGGRNEDEVAAVRQGALDSMAASTGQNAIALSRSLRTSGLGSLERATREATKHGYETQEYADIATSMRAASGGFAGGGAGVGARRANLSMGAVAGYYALQGGGMGGVGGHADPFRLAGASGLYGGNADRLLTMIASSVGKLADSGLQVDLGALQRYVGRFDYAHERGTGERSGIRAARSLGRTLDSVQGARQDLFGGFAGLRKAGALALAMSRSSDLFGADRDLANQAMNPEQAMRDQIGMLGADVFRLAEYGEGAAAQDVDAELAPWRSRPGRGRPAKARAKSNTERLAEEAVKQKNNATYQEQEGIDPERVKTTGEGTRTRQRDFLRENQPGAADKLDSIDRTLKKMNEKMGP